MNLSEADLHLLASAAFDGELADAATDLGLSESAARDALSTWNRYGAVTAAMERTRSNMRSSDPLSEFERERFIAGIRANRFPNALGWTAAAVVIAVLAIGGYLATNRGEPDEMTAKSNRTSAAQQLEAASASDANASTATDAARAADSYSEEATTPSLATAFVAPTDLGAFGTDAEVLAASITTRERLASESASAIRSDAPTPESETSNYEGDPPAPASSTLPFDGTSELAAAPPCNPEFTATLNGIFVGLLLEDNALVILDVESCVEVRRISRPPMP